MMLTSLSWSVWVGQWPSRQSSSGRFSIALSCFRAFFPPHSGRRFVKRRHSTPAELPRSCLESAFFFFFFLSLHLRLIKIMSPNRTKSDDQSASATSREPQSCQTEHPIKTRLLVSTERPFPYMATRLSFTRDPVRKACTVIAVAWSL